MNSAGSYDGTPSQKLELPSDLIEFDDLPIMRKRPRRKTKDAAAPGAATDGQPGNTPHCPRAGGETRSATAFSFQSPPVDGPWLALAWLAAPSPGSLLSVVAE